MASKSSCEGAHAISQNIFSLSPQAICSLHLFIFFLLDTLYPAGDHHLWIVLAFSNPLKVAIGLFLPWTFAQDNSSTSASALIPSCLPCDLAHILSLPCALALLPLPASKLTSLHDNNFSPPLLLFQWCLFTDVSFLPSLAKASFLNSLTNQWSFTSLQYSFCLSMFYWICSMSVEDDLFTVTAMFAVWISSLLPTCNSLLPQLLWHSSVLPELASSFSFSSIPTV